MSYRNLWRAFTMALAGVAVAACGGSGGEEDGVSGSGRLSLSITDAPIHYAQSVTVNFIGVEVKPADAPSLRLYFCENPADPDPSDPTAELPPIVQETECTDSDPHVESIDLLQQTGGASALLLDGVEVPAGRINWVRLRLDDKAGEIVLSTGTHPLELTVPSGSQTGLKLNRGFDVPAGGETHIFIDFDVRKSIVEVHSSVPPSYKLKPSLRLIEGPFGAIAGAVDADLMTDPACEGGSVYVFTGDSATPDDIDRDEGDPFSTALVVGDTESSTGFSYHADFIPPGDYTVAFVCADADEPDEDDTLDFVVFPGPVTVAEDETTRVDIQAPEAP